ncbi:MAG: DUF4437 domain-containing protein [Alphaproteobacteria bacterium]|nr:DUF4437 domain-containing protein [Alphaproteobacteria bacterium]
MTRLLALSLLSSGLLYLTSTATIAESIQNQPAEKLGWKTTPEGVAFAALVGDRFSEPYMAMVKLPSGLISPAHTKTANMFGVIISGAMVHTAVGADPKDDVILPEGSFYKIPKELPHISKCVSETDCVSFLYQDGKFDFLPVATGVPE